MEILWLEHYIAQTVLWPLLDIDHSYVYIIFLLNFIGGKLAVALSQSPPSLICKPSQAVLRNNSWSNRFLKILHHLIITLQFRTSKILPQGIWKDVSLQGWSWEFCPHFIDGVWIWEVHIHHVERPGILELKIAKGLEEKNIHKAHQHSVLWLCGLEAPMTLNFEAISVQGDFRSKWVFPALLKRKRFLS